MIYLYFGNVLYQLPKYLLQVSYPLYNWAIEITATQTLVRLRGLNAGFGISAFVSKTLARFASLM